MDQGLELQLLTVQNFGQVIVQAQVRGLLYPKLNPTNPCILHMQWPRLDIQPYKGATCRLTIAEYPVKGST